MDQPVVVLERLPESVIEKHTKREEMKVFDYNHGSKIFQSKGFSDKKCARKKRFWIKSGGLTSGFYNKPNFHTQSNHKLLANGYYGNSKKQRGNDTYNKADKFHPRKIGNNFIVNHNQVLNSQHQQNTSAQFTSVLGNTTHFSSNQDKVVSNEKVLQQGKKRHRSSENKINGNDSFSTSEEYYEDINENVIQNEEFDSYDWQIISEASCSDISRDSSPSRENLLDAEYSGHTELKDNETELKLNDTLIAANGMETKLLKWQDITQPQKKINQASESDDDDDRSTEPYRSDCEEDIDKEQNDTKYTKPCKSHIRIKLAGSHKNGFTNITNKSKEEKVISNKKGNVTADSCVKPESICSNTSNNHSACPTDIVVNKNLNKESTDHDGVANTVQKKQTVLLLADNNNHYVSEGKSAKTNISQLDGLMKREDLQKQTDEKSELVNATHSKCLSNAENRTENFQNGQNTANKESKFNRYDYVGLIMKTMDKSAPYSVPAKSGEAIQKSGIIDESQTLSFKPNGINKQPNYKEAVMLPSRKELPAMAYFKQKKARMSRVTSMSKSFLCRDLKGTAINKAEYVNYGSRPTEMSLKEHIKIKGDNEKISRNTDTVSNIMNSSNKNVNTQVLTDKQGVKVLGAKTHRVCWRCGKQLSNNNIVTDRLCKQCNAIDYTTVAPKLSYAISNNKSTDISCNFGKETSPSDPCSSKKSLKMYHVKTLSEKQSSEWSKCSGNDTSLQNKYISTTHQEQVETENASLSSLKFVVSLGSNKFVEKTSKDIVTVDSLSKKVKKKRMRSASDTAEGTREIKKHVTAITRQTSDGNLICKISKKRRKNKDLLKRKKKQKLEIEDGSSDVSDGRNQSSDDVDRDVSGYHSEDNITSRCAFKDCSSELSLNHPPRNQSENTVDASSNRISKNTLNKPGNCEVRNVNRGLFLVSFSETDDNVYHIQSGLCERSKRDSNQTVTDQLESSSNLGQNLGSAQVVNQKLSSPDTKTSDSICHKQSCPTLADLQALVDKQQPVTAIHSQETAVSHDSLSLENVTEANKITLPESGDHTVCEDDSESKFSMPIIERVYSLKDVKAENVSDGKRTKVTMPFLYNHNIYNELDAYTTASILDMDGTKERSLTVLMSLLIREYNELQYVHQAIKKTASIDVELQNEKLRHIDNIRTLQLACALFKQCQKCNKELSPEMLKLTPQEISLLLTECGNDMNSDSSTEEKSNLDTNIASLKLGTNDKKEEKKALSGDGDSVTSGISGETKTSSKLVMHTTNSRKTVRFLLDQKLLESSNASATITGTSIPAVKQKSDDDVIYLGVSQLPRSSTQVTQQLDQQTVPQNDVSSSIQLPEAINGKTKDSQNISVSPSVVPPNVSVIKSHVITSPPATSNFISSSGSIPLQVIPAHAVNHPLQVAVSVVTSGAAYQKTAVGYVKHPNYSLPSNPLSIQKESNNISKQQYVVSQLSKLPNGTSWVPSGVQNQWSSHPSQVIQTSAVTNEALGNIRNQAWRNTSPIQSGTPPSVADQQKPMQQMSVAPNAMVPLMNQYGTAVVAGRGIHGGLPMPAPRNLPPVPPMYNHSTARSWHQASNPLNAALRPTQTPVVCIACRKPIGMTCPTGMFCSDLCKKSYCARFPNYR